MLAVVQHFFKFDGSSLVTEKKLVGAFVDDIKGDCQNQPDDFKQQGRSRSQRKLRAVQHD